MTNETALMLDVAKPDNVKGVTDPHRPKDFLDPTEIKIFLDAAKARRQGVRDHLLFLMMYRHGLRCCEAIDIRREDVSFDRATLWVRRLKEAIQECIQSREMNYAQFAVISLLAQKACLGCLSQSGKAG